MLLNKIVRANGQIIDSTSIISCSFIEESNQGTNLSVGNAIAAQIKLEIRSSDNAISQGEELEYYQVEDDIERKIGKFIASKPTYLNRTSYELTAYDNLSKTEKDFSLWLSENTALFPMSFGDLAEHACAFSGVTLADKDFPCSQIQVSAFYSSGITARQVLGWIGTAAGKNVRANVAGEIEFYWYTDCTDCVIAAGKESDDTILFKLDGLSYEQYTTEIIQQVQIKQSEEELGISYPENASGNAYLISDNYLLSFCDAASVGIVAQNIYSVLSTVSYVPCQVSAIKTGRVRAGDIIDIIDISGKRFSTYVMRVEVSPNDTVIRSSGDKNRSASSTSAVQKYSNQPGKMLFIEKSMEGIKATVKKIESDNTGIKESISQIKQDAQKISQSVEEINKDLTGKIEENTSLIEQTALGVTTTVAKSTSKYYTGEYEISVYGFGNPTDLGLDAAQYAWEYYLDQTTGKLYQSDGEQWIDTEVEFELITDTIKSEFSQTAEAIRGEVEDLDGNVASLKLTVEGFDTRIESAEGAASEALQTAQGFDQRVTDAEGNASEAKQTATEASQTVSSMDGRLSKVEQTAGKVSVEVKNENGDVILSTYITEDAWSALRTEGDVVTSGFYFDFELGRFMYKGAGEFYSADGTTFVRIEGNRLVMYSQKDTQELVEKLSIGFTTGRDPDNTYDVDYPFIELGASDNQGEVGLVKKFWDGMWVGNSYPKNDSGRFQAKENYGGFFINTLDGKSYVVKDGIMKNVYTGDAIARFG